METFSLGLKKLSNFKGKTYRGLDKPLTQLSAQYSRNKILCWVTFTSTTKEKEISKSFSTKCGTILELDVTEGKDISGFSLYPGEDQTLILKFVMFCL